MNHAVLTLAAALTLSGTAALAQNQSPGFQGIQGEVDRPADAPLLTDIEGLRFQLGRADPAESSVIRESSPGRTDFYRSTIHNGRRAKQNGATGLTIFDRLFNID